MMPVSIFVAVLATFGITWLNLFIIALRITVKRVCLFSYSELFQFETTIKAIIWFFINVSYIRWDSARKSLKSFNWIHLKIFYHDNLITYFKIYRVIIKRSRDRDPSLVNIYRYKKLFNFNTLFQNFYCQI